MVDQAKTSVFSFSRRTRAADAGTGVLVAAPRNERLLSVSDVGEGVHVPEPDTERTYSPYAEAWKEYDRLEKQAKGGGAIGLTHWAWGTLIPLIGLFMPHRVPRKDSLALVAFLAVLGTMQMLRSQYAKRQLGHWPCPRCHAEWPGKKVEKEPRCAVCGLKLHQMTP